MAGVHQRNRTAWLAVVIGVWLWAAPFVLGYPRYHPFLRGTANDLAAGSAVVTLGFLAAWRGGRAKGALRGLLICSFWLLLSAPVLGLRSGPLHPARVNDVLTGVVLLLVTLGALLLAGRSAPDRSDPAVQRRTPVLWSPSAPGEQPAAFRGRASDEGEERARRSLPWAWTAVGVLLLAAVGLGVAFVLPSVALGAASVVVGLVAGLGALRAGVLQDTTVGQSPTGR